MSAPAEAPDRERLARILEDEGLTTVDGDGGVTRWLGDVVDRALDDALGASLPALAGSAPGIAVLVMLVAGVVLAFVLVRLVGIVRAARRVARAGPAEVTTAIAGPAAPPSRGDIERHLAAGDPAGALRALWRWVAAHVEARGYARPAPDRTNRELLAEVRRAAPSWERLPALARLTNAVDGLLYAGDPLDADAVRALLPLADEVVR